MKGIKIGIVGVCVSLFGIALNNFFEICGGAMGLLFATEGVNPEGLTIKCTQS